MEGAWETAITAEEAEKAAKLQEAAQALSIQRLTRPHLLPTYRPG